MNYDEQQLLKQSIFSLAVFIIVKILDNHHRRHNPGSPLQRDVLSKGPAYANALAEELLGGSPRLFREMFRMKKATFMRLVSWFKNNTELRDRWISVECRVMVIIWIFAFNETQRQAAHRFGISQYTVHDIVHKMLPCFLQLHLEFVTMPEPGWLDPAIELSSDDWIFNGCWGALDGTLVDAFVPVDEQASFYTRKKNRAQNVLALVGLDGRFHCVYPGAPGSWHDSRVFRTAIFEGAFEIPNDRYYLADSGYQGCPGVTVPFRSTLYHLQDWRNTHQPPRNAKEVYNLRHSRLRVGVEIAFGLVKRRWKIIRCSAPEYDFDMQCDMILAVTGLHNFMWEYEPPLGWVDEDLTRGEQEVMDVAFERAVELAERVPRSRRNDDVERRRIAAVLAWKQWQNLDRRNQVR